MLFYRAISILLGAFLLLLSGVATLALRRADLATKLPRHRLLGAVIGLVVLCWCAYEGAGMLPAVWTPRIWALVPLVLVACWWLLDYTAARALGGLLVLMCNHIIQNAFAYNCACRSLYAIVAVIWGIAGLACIAWPWLLRDGLQFLTQRRSYLVALWFFCGFSALVFALLPFLGGAY